VPEPLFEGLPAYEDLDQNTESLIPYARMLRDIVYRRLYPTGTTALVPPSEDALFDEALRMVLERMLGDRLAELTPAEFAAAYRSVNGDAAFAEALERLADLQRRDIERRTRLERMAQQARVSGRLLLGELEAGEVVTIGLFDPARPDLAAKRFSDNVQVRPLHRVLQARIVDPASGAAEIVRDTWVGPVWAERLRTAPADPHGRGLLGTAPDADAALTPELSLHAPLTFRPSSGAELRPPQIVGYVETLAHTLLLDGG
jgi:hypothetical protein